MTSLVSDWKWGCPTLRVAKPIVDKPLIDPHSNRTAISVEPLNHLQYLGCLTPDPKGHLQPEDFIPCKPCETHPRLDPP